MVLIRRLWSLFIILYLAFFGLITPVFATDISTTPQKISKNPDQAAKLTRHFSIGIIQPQLGKHEPVGVDANSGLFQSGKHRPTVVTIIKPEPFLLGDHPVIVVRLTTFTGSEPVSNQPVKIYVDGKQKATSYTDNNGYAYTTLKYKFAAGTYEIEAKFPGSDIDDLDPSSDTNEMVIEATRAVIRIVPPISGVRVVFDGRTFVSDDNGIIRITIGESGKHNIRVLEIEDGIFPPDARAEFERWNDNVYEPEREVYFPRKRPLEIGFVIQHAVSQLFYDSTGEEIPSSRITAITIGGIGKIYNFEDPGPHWLPSNRLVRRIGERLESQQILYYLRDVSIDGVNVINQSEQRFYTRPQSTWPIEVLLYTGQFSGRDALFGFPIGTGVRIEYPNGKFEEFPFGPDAKVEIPALARGQYNVSVMGAGGSAPSIPVYLSRDQSVQLIVISYLDIVVMFGTPILVALALLFYGRPFILAAIGRTLNPRALYYRISRRNPSSSV